MTSRTRTVLLFLHAVFFLANGVCLLIDPHPQNLMAMLVLACTVLVLTRSP